jgi:EAL domain-containing protein (putative c-di-GMP-specific phosphodiesterase class I)
MAHSRGKLTIAEAVQDANSLAVLWQCGINYIQGYFLKEPDEKLDYDFSSSN